MMSVFISVCKTNVSLCVCVRMCMSICVYEGEREEEKEIQKYFLFFSHLLCLEIFVCCLKSKMHEAKINLSRIPVISQHLSQILSREYNLFKIN